eukprot:scaffold1628_cov407-Prasinococcus_capsulatus_cf.AAC.22
MQFADLSPEVAERVEQWLSFDVNQESREQVESLAQAGDDRTLRSLLGDDLKFGTAGLRAKVGPGFCSLNDVTILQTTQGLCSYLEKTDPDLRYRGVVIGYDGRRDSQRYDCVTSQRLHSSAVALTRSNAQVRRAGCSCILAQNGPCILVQHLRPDPCSRVLGVIQVFRCGHRGNGVTQPEGIQWLQVDIINQLILGSSADLYVAGLQPYDQEIASEIKAEGKAIWPGLLDEVKAMSARQVEHRAVLNLQPDEAIDSDDGEVARSNDAAGAASVWTHSLCCDPLEEIQCEYFAQMSGNLCFSRWSAPPLETPLRVAYSPLHGVGGIWARKAFSAFRLPPFIEVKEQFDPDPDFPTVQFPNPEEGADTWALAYATGDAEACSLVFANDPDADRLAVAEKQPDGTWRSFSGNEIGILLAHWLWTNFKERFPKVAPSKVAVLSSTVSSRMLRAFAEAEGLHFEETLTGFKWLGNRAASLEEQGYIPLFAFEEAIGFMFGTILKDKDGISALAVFCEMANHVRQHYGKFMPSWQCRVSRLTGTRLDTTLSSVRRRKERRRTAGVAIATVRIL